MNDLNDSDTIDRLTFWRNWYVAARQLPDDLRVSWYDAVLDFAFTDKVPEIGGGTAQSVGYSAVQMVKATIEISRMRRQNGKLAKGKCKAKRKPNESKRKQTKAKPKQEQEQEQVQEQEQEHNANSITATRAKAAKFSIEQFVTIGETAGVPADFSRERWLDLEARGWIDENGRRTLTSPRAYLKSAWNAEQKKIRAARVSGDDQFGGIRVG